jgi:hypothetical protein
MSDHDCRGLTRLPYVAKKVTKQSAETRKPALLCWPLNLVCVDPHSYAKNSSIVALFIALWLF